MRTLITIPHRCGFGLLKEGPCTVLLVYTAPPRANRTDDSAELEAVVNGARKRLQSEPNLSGVICLEWNFYGKPLPRPVFESTQNRLVDMLRPSFPVVIEEISIDDDDPWDRYEKLIESSPLLSQLKAAGNAAPGREDEALDIYFVAYLRGLVAVARESGQLDAARARPRSSDEPREPVIVPNMGFRDAIDESGGRGFIIISSQLPELHAGDRFIVPPEMNRFGLGDLKRLVEETRLLLAEHGDVL